MVKNQMKKNTILTMIIISLCLFSTSNSALSIYLSEDINNIHAENTDYSIEMELFGILINPLDQESIKNVEQSSLFLSQKDEGFVEINIEINGIYYLFKSIEPKLEILEDCNGTINTRYCLNNYQLGFFSCIEIHENKIWANIAFSIGSNQYNLDGVNSLDVIHGTFKADACKSSTYTLLNHTFNSNYLSVQEMIEMCHS